jgi:RimJ/RimL family protein N-acetyltransferase
MERLDLMLNQWPDAWAVTVRPDDAAVGSFVLRAWADARPVASFGYTLRYDCWNRGYMTEALSLVLEYAFTVKGYLRVGADHFSVNPASGRVMQKCGMVYEGCLRECAYKDGRAYDLLQYGILKRDWERLFRPAGRGVGV